MFLLGFALDAPWGLSDDRVVLGNANDAVGDDAPVRAALAGALKPGAVVGGRYRVERTLGAGGMGAVYEATHLQLGRVVALKLLRPELSSDLEATERFMREARIAASLGHPGIVDVFDLGTSTSGVFLAMERLQGIELADRIEAGPPLSERECVEIAIDIADAVEAAHERGIVHRDLKPQNVFLARVRGAATHVVKVLDFGVAKLTHRDGGSQTKTGSIYGTPSYMPPEQLRGAKDIDGRADVYAVGCILYEMLTGARAFDGASLPELVLKIVSERPRAVDTLRPGLTPALARIVEEAMAPRREERIASMALLRAKLRAHAQTLPSEPPTTPEAPPMRTARNTGRGPDTLPLAPTLATPQGLAPHAYVSERLPSFAPPAPDHTHSLGPVTASATPLHVKADLRAEPGRRALHLGALLVGVVSLAAIAYVAGSALPPPTETPSSTAPTPTPTIAPRATSVAATEPGVTPSEAPPARVVAFTSEPLGVQIVLGDDTCTAPCSFGVTTATRELLARYPGRRDVLVPLPWPPPPAIHVAVPAPEPEVREPATTPTRRVRTPSGTPRAPLGAPTSTAPPLLLPR